MSKPDNWHPFSKSERADVELNIAWFQTELRKMAFQDAVIYKDADCKAILNRAEEFYEFLSKDTDRLNKAIREKP